MSNKKGYFGKYYADNKEKILGDRKTKYHSDPEYREKVLEASRTYRADKQAGPRIKLPRFQKPLVHTLSDGSEIKLYSIGAFGMVLGRSVQSIAQWEQFGSLPATPYRDARGFRYFTRAMMVAVKEAIGTKKRLYPPDPEMANTIRRKWSESGVPVDEHGGMDAAVAATIPQAAQVTDPPEV